MASSSSVVAVQEMGYSWSDLEPELWYACAGALVEIPPVNSMVYYFVQGHVEHASASGSTVDLDKIKNVPDRIICRVQEVKYLIDQRTDEVLTRIKLKPVTSHDPMEDTDNDAAAAATDNPGTLYGSKKLTKRDVSSYKLKVPLMVTNKVFFPGIQVPSHAMIQFKDVHGHFSWNFVHDHHRNLTGMWTRFLTEKGPEPGDTILFIRDTARDLRIGIRRTKGNNVRVRAESVVEAAKSAADLEPFEIEYYPRLGTPEFVVKAKRVDSSIQKEWTGLEINRLVEDENFVLHAHKEPGRVVATGQVIHPIHWPNSHWKSLKVKLNDDSFKTSKIKVISVSPWTVSTRIK